MIENLVFLTPLSVANKLRIGPQSDGGYVVYKPSLYHCDVLISYGIGWDMNFEIDYYNLTNKKVLMFDPTMFMDTYINKFHCKSLLRKLQFYRLYAYLKLSYVWKKRIEYLKKYDMLFFNEGLSNKKEGKYDSFQNHLAKHKITTEKIILKIDIEENEYSVLNETGFYNHLDSVDQIIIEFHNLKNRLRELKSIIYRLKELFEIVHIHGNNNSDQFTLYTEKGDDICFPDVIEVTLVKKTSILPGDILSEKIDYPCPGLDFPNTASRNDFIKLRFQ